MKTTLNTLFNRLKTLIKNGTIVNEGCRQKGNILIDGEYITDISEQEIRGDYDETVDASDCYILPGVIDSHVHFREPGLTEKADIESESRAAAFGGVTTFFDMPNTVPQTTTLDDLEEKFTLAKDKSHVNYSFFFGATNQNTDLFPFLDIHRIPGIKLFMGSSTGYMLVDKQDALKKIFHDSPTLLMAHCEDTSIINYNMNVAKQKAGEDPPVWMHPIIRSREACIASTSLAVKLAKTYGTHLHIAHISTADELDFFGKCSHITAEAAVPHLFFRQEDYSSLGSLIKCNPSIKTSADRDALWKALSDGRITTVATDHAPHLFSEKQGGAAQAMSGMPMLQFSLPALLELSDKGILTIERVVELMCHQPAKLFAVRKRGFLRPGYKADIVIVRPHSTWTVTKELIQSKCKWSPLNGHTFQWRVEHTFCNGHHILNNGVFASNCIGQEVQFR